MNLQAKRAFAYSFSFSSSFCWYFNFYLYERATKTTLFSSLTEADKAKVVESLRQKGINVSLDTATGEVLVPIQLLSVKMLIAAEGLPESLPSGFDSLSDLPMGTSRSVEAVKIRQSQESELARSINEISGILGARESFSNTR